MNKTQTQRRVGQASHYLYQFLAWRKLAECYGILADENLFKIFSSWNSEETLAILLQLTKIFLSEAKKLRAIEEQQHYFLDYSGAYK